MSTTDTYDVVVVGSGAAAFATAIGAAEEGLSVVMLESTDGGAAARRCLGAACGCRTTR